MISYCVCGSINKLHSPTCCKQAIYECGGPCKLDKVDLDVTVFDCRSRQHHVEVHVGPRRTSVDGKKPTVKTAFIAVELFFFVSPTRGADVGLHGPSKLLWMPAARDCMEASGREPGSWNPLGATSSPSISALQYRSCPQLPTPAAHPLNFSQV